MTDRKYSIEELEKEIKLLERYEQLQEKVIRNDEKLAELKDFDTFYTVADVMMMTKMSATKVQQLFKDPEFPCCDYGKRQIIRKEKFDEYFSVPRIACESPYWKKISFGM